MTYLQLIEKELWFLIKFVANPLKDNVSLNAITSTTGVQDSFHRKSTKQLRITGALYHHPGVFAGDFSQNPRPDDLDSWRVAA